MRTGDIDGLPPQIGLFLRALLRRNRRLQVYLLYWDYSVLYSMERPLLSTWKLRFSAPRRFHFRLASDHPVAASHHQKIVVIDDRVAFCGGLDLTKARWDTPEHRADDMRRRDPYGEPYAPFHDMQMIVDGDAARALGDLFRTRWGNATGKRLRAPSAPRAAEWPDDLAPAVQDAEVGIVRTEPKYEQRPAVREVEQLYLDAIASAQRWIYIENQYFTSERMAQALAARLREPDAPEIVLVLPRHTGPWLEQNTMDVLRARVLKNLRADDAHGRLKIYYPHIPGLEGDDCVIVHSKLIIVDDRLVRIGSSNLSNRSMGLDTECDLVLESAGQREPERIERAIADLRARLLAEHLGQTEQAVADALQREDSLLRAIDALRGNERTLCNLECELDELQEDLVPDAAVLDPDQPLGGAHLFERYLPEAGRKPGRKRMLAFIVLLVLLLAGAAVWKFTPLAQWLDAERLAAAVNALDSFPQRLAATLAAYVIGGLLIVPLVALVIATALAFGPTHGFVLAMTGALASAAVGYGLGRWFKRYWHIEPKGKKARAIGERPGERQMQVCRLCDELECEAQPATVVLGDLNEWWPFGCVQRRLRQSYVPLARPRSFPARRPLLTLDAIWSQPALPVLAAGAHASALARRASDHLPVWADVLWHTAALESG